MGAEGIHRVSREGSGIIAAVKVFKCLEFGMHPLSEGKVLVRLIATSPSSQLCSHCDAINSEVKDLSVWECICKVCRTHHDRERNTAASLYKETIRMLNRKLAGSSLILLLSGILGARMPRTL